MKIAICDDEQIFIDAIKKRVLETMKETGIDSLDFYEFKSGLALIEAQKKEGFHAVFLDINMPDMDGRDVAKSLRATSYDLMIAFFSSYDGYVYDCFDVFPIGYIRKALMDSDVRKICLKIAEKYKESNVEITLDLENKKITFYPSKIWYIESDGKKLFLHSEGGKTDEMKYPIKKMNILLKDKGFIRIHKSFLSNYKYMYRLEKEEVLLIDMETRLPLAKNRIAKIRDEYFSWLGGR